MKNRSILVTLPIVGAAPSWASTAWADVSNLMDPMGPIAEMQRLELIWASVIVFVAVAPVLIGVPWIFWQYRRANENATYKPGWDFDNKLEAVMWVIPTLIIIAFSVWLVQAVYRIDPYRIIDAEMAENMEFDLNGPAVRVDVIGLDWKWLFIYPDEGVASVGEMVIPRNRPVSLRVTSDTVMQSFFASGLAGQIYAMPGMVTRLQLLADRTGETQVENTQYNGPGFARQRAPLRAVEDADFTGWIALGRGAPPLDDRTYALLAQDGDLMQTRAILGRRDEGKGVASLMFSVPDPAIFDRVVTRYLSGEPVPPQAQPGSEVYDPDAGALPQTALLRHQLDPDKEGWAFADGDICISDPELQQASLAYE